MLSDACHAPMQNVIKSLQCKINGDANSNFTHLLRIYVLDSCGNACIPVSIACFCGTTKEVVCFRQSSNGRKEVKFTEKLVRLGSSDCRNPNYFQYQSVLHISRKFLVSIIHRRNYYRRKRKFAPPTCRLLQECQICIAANAAGTYFSH